MPSSLVQKLLGKLKLNQELSQVKNKNWKWPECKMRSYAGTSQLWKKDVRFSDSKMKVFFNF